MTHLLFKEMSELKDISKSGSTYFSVHLARGNNDLEGDIYTDDVIVVGSIVRDCTNQEGVEVIGWRRKLCPRDHT